MQKHMPSQFKSLHLVLTGYSYFLSGYLAPGLVSSPSDIIEYFVSNSTPVDPSAGKGYSERFIHGEVLRRFSGVNSVVHSHAEAVLPYAISGVPLLPVFHMGGFLGRSYSFALSVRFPSTLD